MKFPKALLALTAALAGNLLFVGVFTVEAVRRRNLLAAMHAAIAALASWEIVKGIEDYCHKASFSPRVYFDVNRKIDDFFAAHGTEAGDILHD